MKQGGQATINDQWAVNRKIDLQASVDYKTAGFVMGESLKQGAIIKLGVGLTF